MYNIYTEGNCTLFVGGCFMDSYSIVLCLTSTFSVREQLYIYIQEVMILESDPQHPPPTHTSDRPICKIPFDSENLGKFIRYRIDRLLIFASQDPLNCYHIFWVKLALYHKCTFFTHGYSRDIPRRRSLSY